MKNTSLINITTWFLIVFGLILLAIIIPNLIHMSYPKPESEIKLSMHSLQVAVDSFSILAKGYYPSNINITVQEVLKDLDEKAEDSISVAGADNDTVFSREIGSAGPALLPFSFKNPYDDSKPVLITSKVDPPVWNKKIVGVVYYVPLGVKGNIAKGYKIYGAGKDGLLSLVLSSKSNKKDGN